MEYIFYILVVVLVVGYLIDPKGFKSTGKRIVTIVRSNIEAGMPVKQIEPSKEHDEWTQKFKEIENPPSAALKPIEKPSRHVIVKTDFYETHLGPWPRWNCKCGAKQYEVVGTYGRNPLDDAIERAKRAGEQHVRDATKADEMKAKTKGAFSW